MKVCFEIGAPHASYTLVSRVQIAVFYSSCVCLVGYKVPTHVGIVLPSWGPTRDIAFPARVLLCHCAGKFGMAHDQGTPANAVANPGEHPGLYL